MDLMDAPAPSFEDPVALLLACHRRIEALQYLGANSRAFGAERGGYRAAGGGYAYPSLF